MNREKNACPCMDTVQAKTFQCMILGIPKCFLKLEKENYLIYHFMKRSPWDPLPNKTLFASAK